jgi:hypothetical protein
MRRIDCKVGITQFIKRSTMIVAIGVFFFCVMVAHAANECDQSASECIVNSVVDDDIEELHSELNRIQTRPCDAAASRRLMYAFWNNGLGAEIHALSLALTLSFLSNRTLVTPSGGKWVYAAEAGAFGDESLYFEPLSKNCFAPAIDAWNSTPWWRGGAFDAAQGALVWSNDSNEHEPALLFTTDITPNPWLLRLAVPRRFERRGLLWWRSALVAYIFRLRPELQRRFDDEWSRLSIGAATASEHKPLADCVGVHIRRGDKVREDSSQASVEQYIEAARAFGLGHIVLASDDPAILARTDLPADVHLLRHDAFSAGGFDQAKLNFAHYNRTAAAHATLRDIALLSKCAASVGTMSSNLSRLVHELQTAALGRAAPFTSLSNHKQWWVFP